VSTIDGLRKAKAITKKYLSPLANEDGTPREDGLAQRARLKNQMLMEIMREIDQEIEKSQRHERDYKRSADRKQPTTTRFKVT
jgi:hypothetical protein